MADFHLLITDWFRQNCRDLPWRKTKDPYKIWLSEIILQQTRVDQGLAYYQKFVKNYPTVFDLANADEQAVLRDWQGLGYYSRARNLHSAAKYIVEQYKGVFPKNFVELKTIKGVGDYTASAIASIAFDLPHAVVDGNVYRVLSRCFDIDLAIDSTEGIKYFKELAQSLLGGSNHGEHNQALMEIGALVCKPQNPVCEICPLQTMCLAKKNTTIAIRPIKTKKTKVRDRFFHFLIFEKKGKFVFEQRTAKDIWQNMYQFPLIESQQALETSDLLMFGGVKFQSETITHILSHQKIHARFYHFEKFPDDLRPNWKQFSLVELDDYPIPRLIEGYLQTCKIFH